MPALLSSFIFFPSPNQQHPLPPQASLLPPPQQLSFRAPQAPQLLLSPQVSLFSCRIFLSCSISLHRSPIAKCPPPKLPKPLGPLLPEQGKAF
ncbi:hypothetical protein M0R45_035048 [Rubus argutus]|uniref:Uncharacterized protein n=1 Tax=Rubus argutus TaxID=59490 RepID=A0AAW1VXB8_RUBAR